MKNFRYLLAVLLLCIGSQAQFVTGVAANPSSTSAVATWNSCTPSQSLVKYGTTSSYGSTAGDSALVTAHVVQLPNLTPQTTYHFATVTTDSAGTVIQTPDQTFVTPLPAAPPAPKITAQPTNPTTATTATFSFTDTQAGVLFGCSLDGAAIVACSTGVNYSPLTVGNHTFSVQAKDSFGTPSTNAGYAWAINATLPPPVTLAIDTNVFKDTSTAATTIVSPALTTAGPNELVLAFIATDTSATVGSSIVSGVTGGGLTWTLVKRANATNGDAEVWQAFATAKLTAAVVTATTTASVAGSISVVSFVGAANTVGASANASSASGAASASLTTTVANSLVFGVGADWDHATARTLGANQTLVHQYLATINSTYWVQRQTLVTPNVGTVVTINDTAPVEKFNLVVVEVAPSSTVVTPPPPALTVQLFWDPSPTNGVTYNVYRATSTSGPFVNIAANITALTYTDTTAVRGTTYTYVARAFFAGAESIDSNQITITGN